MEDAISFLYLDAEGESNSKESHARFTVRLGSVPKASFRATGICHMMHPDIVRNNPSTLSCMHYKYTDFNIYVSLSFLYSMFALQRQPLRLKGPGIMLQAGIMIITSKQQLHPTRDTF